MSWPWVAGWQASRNKHSASYRPLMAVQQTRGKAHSHHTHSKLFYIKRLSPFASGAKKESMRLEDFF